MVGETLAQVGARARGSANIVAIERRKGAQRELLEPRADMALRAGDVLLVDFPEPIDDARAQRLAELKLEALPLRGRYFTDQSRDLGMAEVLLPPDSELIGQTVLEDAFRRKYRLNVIGLRRKAQGAARRAWRRKNCAPATRCSSSADGNTSANCKQQKREFLVLSLPAEIDQVAPAAQPRAVSRSSPSP